MKVENEDALKLETLCMQRYQDAHKIFGICNLQLKGPDIGS